MDFYPRLKEMRSQLKLTQKEIAESIGIDQRQYSRYENNINEIPCRYIVTICKQYKISADWLLGIKE